MQCTPKKVDPQSCNCDQKNCDPNCDPGVTAIQRNCDPDLRPTAEKVGRACSRRPVGAAARPAPPALPASPTASVRSPARFPHAPSKSPRRRGHITCSAACAQSGFVAARSISADVGWVVVASCARRRFASVEHGRQRSGRAHGTRRSAMVALPLGTSSSSVLT